MALDLTTTIAQGKKDLVKDMNNLSLKQTFGLNIDIDFLRILKRWSIIKELDKANNFTEEQKQCLLSKLSEK